MPARRDRQLVASRSVGNGHISPRGRGTARGYRFVVLARYVAFPRIGGTTVPAGGYCSMIRSFLRKRSAMQPIPERHGPVTRGFGRVVMGGSVLVLLVLAGGGGWVAFTVHDIAVRTIHTSDRSNDYQD